MIYKADALVIYKAIALMIYTPCGVMNNDDNYYIISFESDKAEFIFAVKRSTIDSSNGFCLLQAKTLIKI